MGTLLVIGASTAWHLIETIARSTLVWVGALVTVITGCTWAVRSVNRTAVVLSAHLEKERKEGVAKILRQQRAILLTITALDEKVDRAASNGPMQKEIDNPDPMDILT